PPPEGARLLAQHGLGLRLRPAPLLSLPRSYRTLDRRLWPCGVARFAGVSTPRAEPAVSSTPQSGSNHNQCRAVRDPPSTGNYQPRLRHDLVLLRVFDPLWALDVREPDPTTLRSSTVARFGTASAIHGLGQPSTSR